jgi:hypothetical protein
MSGFNRFVAIVLWITLLGLSLWLAVFPIGAVTQMQSWLGDLGAFWSEWQQTNPTNFLIAQIAGGVAIVALFALLLWAEFATMRRRGVRIQTANGGSVELDTNSIGRRLSWHLDQVADVITVLPNVRPRGSSVDIRLEIEAAPDVDIPLKTEEVVQLTREIVEQELGLKMGKLDVQMRCAPFEPNWAG